MFLAVGTPALIEETDMSKHALPAVDHYELYTLDEPHYAAHDRFVRRMARGIEERHDADALDAEGLAGEAQDE